MSFNSVRYFPSGYDEKVSSTVNPAQYSPAHSPVLSPTVSPVKPQVRINQSETSVPQAQQPNHSFKIKPFVVTFLPLVLFPLFAIF